MNKGAFKNHVILLGGEGGSPKRSQNITGGGGGDHKKITEDHDHKGGGGKYMAKLNNYSQDQLCSYAPIEIFWHPPPKKFRKHATSPKILEL